MQAKSSGDGAQEGVHEGSGGVGEGGAFVEASGGFAAVVGDVKERHGAKILDGMGVDDLGTRFGENLVVGDAGFGGGHEIGEELGFVDGGGVGERVEGIEDRLVARDVVRDATAEGGIRFRGFGQPAAFDKTCIGVVVVLGVGGGGKLDGKNVGQLGKRRFQGV